MSSSRFAKQLSIETSDDDDCLFIAPHQQTAARNNAMAKKPRLSSTGASPTDPVDLENNDNDIGCGDSTSSLEVIPLSERLANRRQQQATTAGTAEVQSNKSCQAGTEKSDRNAKADSSLSLRRVIAHTVSMSSVESPLSLSSAGGSKVARKNATRTAVGVRQPAPSNSDDEEDSDEEDTKLFQKLVSAKNAGGTSTRADGSKKRVAATTNKNFQFSSSSDDDDSLLRSKYRGKKASAVRKRAAQGTTAKAAKNPYSKEQREADKADKKRKREEERAAKQRGKEEARAKREEERQQRKQAEAEAKQQKKRAREEVGQARGKFAHEEVAVLVEPALFRHEVFKMQEAFEDQGGNYAHVHSYPSALSCLAVQWVRRDYLNGGAAKALEMANARRMDEFEQLDTLAVVFDCPHDFLDLIQQDDDDDSRSSPTASRRTLEDDDDDFPKLEDWLLGLVAGWRAAWRKTSDHRPRIYLLLYQVQQALDKAWVAYNRNSRNKNRGPRPPNGEQLHDAILWMLIQFQIEVIHCEKEDDVPRELAKMTRFLAESRYRSQTTELHCVQKIKPKVSDMAPCYDRAVDCWMRQLQQIPRVSSEMARCFCNHYPTARSLWLAYHKDDSLSLEEKQVLVAHCFGTRASQVKLSRWLFRIFTSQDAHELLT